MKEHRNREGDDPMSVTEFPCATESARLSHHPLRRQPPPATATILTRPTTKPVGKPADTGRTEGRQSRERSDGWLGCVLIGRGLVMLAGSPQPRDPTATRLGAARPRSAPQLTRAQTPAASVAQSLAPMYSTEGQQK